MELNQQVFRAPSIPKIGKKTVSSSVIRGALKPQVKLRKSTFSFIKPIGKGVDTEKLSGGTTASSNLSETNRILVEIQKQLALDFAYRIAEEKKALAAEKKRISAQKVADKESKIEKGGKSLLGKTFDKVTAPIKSIFQKLIDFFSIILTGILLNTAFNWLSKEENREKLKKFFNFLKDYWQELLIIFGAYKLAKLVGKIYKIGKIFGKLFDIFKKKPPQLPCKCPKTSPTTDLCGKILDCIKNPASAFITTLVKTLVAGGFILGAGSLKSLEGLLNGGLIPAAGASSAPGATPSAPAAPVTAPTKPTYEQIKANFDPRRDFSYYQKLGLSRKEWTRLQMDPSVGGGVRGDLQTYIDKPGQTFGMAFNILSLLPFLGAFGGASKIATTGAVANTAAPTLTISRAQRITNAATGGAGRTITKRPILPKNVTDGTTKILNNPSLTDKFLQFLKQNKSFRRSGSNPGGLNTIDDFAQFSNTTSENLVKSQYKNFLEYLTKSSVKPSVKLSKGGTIFASNGMTVPGKGSGLVDSVRALLAPGEEVIRASMARLFRPLLKNINDNGGKEWLAFSNAIGIQRLNNAIQSELNIKFEKLITDFKNLIESQIEEERRKKRKKTPNKGPASGNAGPHINVQKQKIESTPSSINPYGNSQRPDVIQNISPTNVVNNNTISPQLTSNKNNIVVVPIPVKNLKKETQQPKVNVINLPPKTVNLAPKQGSVKTPSSGSATEVPSISPFDGGNPYISSLRLEYGMVM